jgi:hypothetical protein
MSSEKFKIFAPNAAYKEVLCENACWSALTPDNKPIRCQRPQGHYSDWHWNLDYDLDWGPEVLPEVK